MKHQMWAFEIGNVSEQVTIGAMSSSKACRALLF
jgi:hypothetical protein